MSIRCALLAACAAAPVFAQTPEPAPTPLEPLLVTATGHAMPARDALASVVVITRDEIERAQASDLPELLRFHAGIELGRNGGPGAITSVFVRGGESNHTLLLVDGVRVNPSSSGGAALQNIAPDMIERIEVVKGPRATLYGSDAIAAVINVITRGASAPALELRARGGSFGTRDAAAFVAGGDGTTGAALHVQQFESEGFAPLAVGGPDRGARDTTANLRANTGLGGMRLSAQGWRSAGRAEYQGFGGPQDQDFVNEAYALGAGLAAGGWDLGARASLMQDEIEQNQSADFVATRRTSAALDAALAFDDGQRLSLGVERAREDVGASAFGTPIEERRDLTAAHVQYEVAAGPHALLAAVGAADHDAFGSQATWNLEYGYRVFAGTQLVAAAGTGFRAPDATDRFGFGGNPALDPERARNYELALRQDLGARQRVELRAFLAEVEDLISVECVANCADADPFNDTFSAQNVDEYRNRGLELAWRFAAAGWSVRVEALKQRPRSEARPDPCSGGARVCRRADESASASLARHWDASQLGLDVLGVGDRVDFGEAPLPGYALLNAGGIWQWHPHFSVGARIENLLDHAYQTALGYRQAGRSYYLTAGWRL